MERWPRTTEFQMRAVRHLHACLARSRSRRRGLPDGGSQAEGQQPGLAPDERRRDQGHSRQRSRGEGEALALVGMEPVEHGLRRPVLRPPAEHRAQTVAVLVLDDPLGGVDQVVRLRRAGASRGPRLRPRAGPRAGRRVPDRWSGGPAGCRWARRSVSEPLASQHQVAPHVERGRHLLVAVEPRLGVVAERAAADRADPVPGEVGREVPQPRPGGARSRCRRRPGSRPSPRRAARLRE